MISPGDLRIGNLVQEGVVTVIDGNRLLLFILPDGQRNDIVRKTVTCNPIPLSEHWLSKLGFEKTKSDKWNILVSPNSGMKFDFSILKSEDGMEDFSFSFYHNGLPFFHIIEYVHQLQNLFYCLTGSELTVK